MKCKICNNDTVVLFEKKVLNKYDVQYHRCNTCAFIQTDEPYWLNEAYSNAINFSDVGLLYRNKMLVEKVTTIFALNKYEPHKKYLDYGGGYGIFVRMMRDNGYNFYWDDEYCENTYAKLFSAKDLPQNEQSYEVLTAFEVFEHLVDPMSEIEKMLALTGSILFSTELTYLPEEELKNWWYIGENHGQHVALFNIKTLEYICQKFGLNLYSHKNLHFISRKNLNALKYKMACTYKIARLYNTVFPTSSLLEKDFNKYLNWKPDK